MLENAIEIELICLSFDVHTDYELLVYWHFNFILSPPYIVVVQSLSRVWLFANPWTAARQASLSITNSRSYSNSYPLSRWCHPTISSSVIPFSSCLQSFPASGAFPMSWLFASGGFQGKPLSITVIQVYALTTNAEEAKVYWFYEDLQDLLEHQKKMSFSS